MPQQLIVGDTFWDTTGRRAIKNTPWREGISADVLIVGAGMSGTLTAWHLCEAGYKVLLIERERVGHGSTSANTGLLQYSSDMSLSKCIEKYGEKEGVLFYKACVEGVDTVEKVCAQLPSGVHFHRRSSLCYASNPKDAAKVREEYAALKKYGFAAEYLGATALEKRFGIRKPNAYITHGDAEINPFAFVQQAVYAAQKKWGLQVMEKTEYLSHEKAAASGRLTAQTTRGAVHCSHIVLTTGYAENSVSTITRPLTQPVRSYALVAETDMPHETPLWEGDMLIWETARPYLYVRRAQGGRILVGGLDEEMNTLPANAWTEKQCKKLVEKFHKLFPKIAITPTHCYSAIFGEALDGKPSIGRHPQMPHTWALFGYGGNGTVYSALGAKLIVKGIAGKRSPYTGLFRLDRRYKRLPDMEE